MLRGDRCTRQLDHAPVSRAPRRRNNPATGGVIAAEDHGRDRGIHGARIERSLPRWRAARRAAPAARWKRGARRGDLLSFSMSSWRSCGDGRRRYRRCPRGRRSAAPRRGSYVAWPAVRVRATAKARADDVGMPGRSPSRSRCATGSPPKRAHLRRRVDAVELLLQRLLLPRGRWTRMGPPPAGGGAARALRAASSCLKLSCARATRAEQRHQASARAG